MAHYFNYFPKMYYDAVGNNNPQLVTNILKRVKVRDGLKNELDFVGIVSAITKLDNNKIFRNKIVKNFITS